MSSAAAPAKSSLSRIAMLVALALAGLSLFYALRSGDTQETLLSTGPDSIGIPQEQAQDPDKSRLAAHAAVGSPRAAYAGVHADPAAVLAQLRKSMADVPAQRDERDRMVVELEKQHRAEPVDATWSAQSELDILSAAIEPVMLRGGFEPRDLATECRSRTCRISARFADSGDAQDWSNSLVMQMGATLSQVRMTIMPQSDGSSEVRIYGARTQRSSGILTRSRLRI